MAPICAGREQKTGRARHPLAIGESACDKEARRCRRGPTADFAMDLRNVCADQQHVRGAPATRSRRVARASTPWRLREMTGSRTGDTPHLDVREQGGNAVDAAVAVGLALAVTHPQAGNLGGGGFMVIAQPDRNILAAIDYREAAPLATTRNIFLTAQGDADPAKSLNSGLGVGVPGTVAGLALALDKYGSGRFSLAALAAPAIRLAREGIAVEDDLADTLARFAPRLERWPSSAAVFLGPGGAPLQRGATLRQGDL